MYSAFIRRKFPHNEKENMWVAPQLPGGKLGRILMKETRIAQPGDVVAMYLDSGLFGSTYFLFTGTHAFYPDGSFELERVRGASADGKSLDISLGNNTGLNKVRVKLGDSDAAAAVAKVLDDLAFHEAKAISEAMPPEEAYKEFEGKALDWLLLRDEVMRTIDMLHERFQEGKLSLLEYENKKSELLSRF